MKNKTGQMMGRLLLLLLLLLLLNPANEQDHSNIL